jgi:alkaline phosphatase
MINKKMVNGHSSNKFNVFFSFLFIALLFTSSAEAGARYVFFFIGDGMGAAQRNAAELYLAGMRSVIGDDAPRESQLAMNSLPEQGEINTSSKSGVTDSAAAGTALATGQKTTNGSIAMDGGGKGKFKSIAEIARENGMKVGIITTAFIQDATPAVFYAKAPKRTLYHAIGLQLTTSGFDYFAGGGFREQAGGKKQESLIDAALASGYRVTSTLAEFQSLAPGGKAIAINPKTLSGYMPWAIDAGDGDISLAAFVKKGIDMLDGDKGFFMMVEGGKVDLACHANDAASAIHEVIALDEAVLEALEFYRSRPDDTLIVVTSDHETGGMTLSSPHPDKVDFYRAMSRQRGSYSAFERKISPQSGAVIDRYLKNADDFFGGDIAATEAVRRAFADSMTPKKDRPVKDKDYQKRYGPYDPFTIACMREMNAAAGVSWSSFYHTGKPVPVSAIGAGSEAFAGVYDNTEIFLKLRDAMSF